MSSNLYYYSSILIFVCFSFPLWEIEMIIVEKIKCTSAPDTRINKD